MKHRAHPDFDACCERLPPRIRKRVARCREMLKETPPRPSLQLKRVDSPRVNWTARVNDDYRMAAKDGEDDTLIWFFVGTHAEHDKLLRRR